MAPSPTPASRMLPLLALTLASISIFPPAEGATVPYTLTATYGFWAPDCVTKQVALLNGQFPGPVLSGVEGDVMEVTVFNKMETDALSIHWHGIRMLNNNHNDGTPFVTECPIGPRDTRTYKFVLDKAGTYMYHGHLGFGKTAGLYGLLVVQEKKTLPSTPPTSGSRRNRNRVVTFPAYDAELHMILNDWYHLSIYEQVAVLDDNGWVFDPQSLLINGRGEYNCSLVPDGGANAFITGDVKVCNQTSTQCGPEVFEVEQGKTYRLRIGSITSLASLNLVIEGHPFSVEAADAYSVQSFTVGSEGLDIYSGQTVDVVFTANQSVGNYWIRTALFGQPSSATFGRAILRYKGAPAARPTSDLPPLNADEPYAQAVKYKARKKGIPTHGDTPAVGKPNIPPTPLVLQVDLFLLNGYTFNFISNVSLDLPSTPYAHGLARGRSDLYQQLPLVPASKPLQRSATYYNFQFGSYVDIVLQNNPIALFGGFLDLHPWHMHGHHFWVLAHGNGTFDPLKDTAQFNLVDPPLRFTVPNLNNGVSSWTAIRFKADNPGAWLFHCHIEYHNHQGMAVVFTDGFVLPLPKKTRLCGALY